MTELGGHWNLADVDARLENVKRTFAADDSQQPKGLWAYVDAAALLGSFDPEELNPLTEEEPGKEGLVLLLKESIPLFDEDGQAHWRLKASARRAALERLGGRDGILRASAQNAVASDDALHRAFMKILSDGELDVDRTDYRQLTAILEAAEALEGIVEPLPHIGELTRLVERASVFRPLHDLVGDWFRGREKELAYLAEYVSPGESRRSLLHARREHDLPLLVYGLGGIGKSTLLAKFILDQVASSSRLVFTYLDFDRSTITAADPQGVILEMARQLAVQADTDSVGSWQELSRRWATVGHEPSHSSDSVGLQALMSEFATCFRASFDESAPLLAVFDSFEEVQRRSEAYVGAVWRLIADLRTHLPSLRPVFVGRALLESRKVESLELTVLDHEAALGFLHAHGISDAETAEMIIDRVGRRPLTLLLAAEIVSREQGGTEALRDLPRRQRLAIFSVDHKTAQVELYRRLLRHTQDPDVQKLAHPGLVLRRITPDLIKEVLAEPCRIDVRSIEDARDLLEKLRTEITLVRTTPDGALEHRSDIRRAMLPMIRETEPNEVRSIHELAIRYFSSRDGIADRAEEIYHRLAAGEDPSKVDARWLPGVEGSLRSAVDELPARAQAYLAPRVSVEIDEKTSRKARNEDRELGAGRRARNLLDVGQPAEALAVLANSGSRAPGSRLYLYEAEAQLALAELARATKTVDEALEGLYVRGSGTPALELLSLGARIASLSGDHETALRRIDEAYELARWLDEAPVLLSTGARRLELWRGTRRDDERGFLVVAADVYKDVSRLGRETLSAQPAAAHRIAAELGGEYPVQLTRISEAAGLPELRPARVRRAIIHWNRELRGRLDRDAAAQRIIGGDQLPPAVAMDILLGLLARHDLTDGAAGQIATEVRYTLNRPERGGR